MRHVLFYTVAAMILGQIPLSYAESVKLVQWWDEYLPQKFEKRVSMSYSRKGISQQEQDLNGDGVYNDALVCREFSMANFFNPLYYGCLPESNKGYQYRIDRPSAPFYGGLVGRYTNVSHITEDYRGEQIPIFRKTGQATVQPVEGTKPNLYNTKYPHNTSRASISTGQKGIYWGLGWADITYSILSAKGFSAFDTKENIEQNFTFVSIWKKANFVNGGAKAETITFDQTSRLSVDVARGRYRTGELRFVAQDGSQLWISEYAYDVEGKPFSTVKLNPLNSRWAFYTPSGCDMEFNRKTATFVEHSFENVQAVGVYVASYEFTHKRKEIIFDNFQAYAATSKPSSKFPIDNNPIGFAIDSKGEPVNTDATFSRGIAVNGGTVTVSSSNQMDIRGVITVDSNHIGKEAEILVVVGYQLDSVKEESFFMFNKDGSILPWDKSIANLVAYQETDLFFHADDKSAKRFKQNIILMPERRVQIFPVTLSAFRDNELETVLLGCERPRTYSGLVNGIPPGLLRFFFGYRLREDGTIVYNRESINVMITSD